MTLDYGNYGIFIIMGNAGFISSTVVLVLVPVLVLVLVLVVVGSRCVCRRAGWCDSFAGMC